eukprot:531158-Amphidinium_carterae.1
MDTNVCDGVPAYGALLNRPHELLFDDTSALKIVGMQAHVLLGILLLFCTWKAASGSMMPSGFVSLCALVDVA